ncbi:hypothetical protein TSMEX_004069 [Taenia solium]|eukprot:TsM_001180200 transcript=TsM_001180200 gene=TsM_001180200
MKRELADGKLLDFGELTPVFWSLVFAGTYSQQSMRMVVCSSLLSSEFPAYLAIFVQSGKYDSAGHSRAPNLLMMLEYRRFSFDHRPQIQTMRQHHGFSGLPPLPASNTSTLLRSQLSRPPTLLRPGIAPSHSLMFTLAYAEVVQVSSSYNQTNAAESSATVTREVALSTPYGASFGVEVRPGPVEPSAPYPSLPHRVE